MLENPPENIQTLVVESIYEMSFDQQASLLLDQIPYTMVKIKRLTDGSFEQFGKQK